ncbi:MAG: hypothetical protein K2X38_20145 [Gemmataceae bacterium]|nr:hypothetical protein [Gemmataceae bacterium]
MATVDEPNDIDALLVLPPDWDANQFLRPFEYRFFWRSEVRKDYEMDLFPVVHGTLEEGRWLEFFAQVRIEWCNRFGWPTDLKKGVVRILL